MTKKCKLHWISYIRRPNSTIEYCPKCAIESQNKRKSGIREVNKLKKDKRTKWTDLDYAKMKEYVQSKFCNPYIRWRDELIYGKCISSRGQIKHAGHYFSVGSHNGMRYHIMNIHGQSISSNMYKSGDLINYRKGLIRRHGQEFMDKLELEEQKYKQYGKKFTRYDLICIGLTYKYLLENEIVIFDISEFNKYFDEIYRNSMDI